MHYVELYKKKDRDFHIEDDLMLFEDGQGKFSSRRRSLLFHQAVNAAKGLEESEMDVEYSASFRRSQFLKNYPRRPENMQKSSEVDFVPSKRHLKNNSTREINLYRDLSSQDINEFSEFRPLIFTAGRKVPKVGNVPETNTRSETSIMDLSIRKHISQLDQTPESNLHAKLPLPMNVESRINPELESKRGPEGEKNLESKSDDETAPLEYSIKRKNSKVEKVFVRKSGRKIKRRRCFTLTKTQICDQTVQESKSNDFLGKTTILKRVSEEETKVNDLPDEKITLVEEIRKYVDSLKPNEEDIKKSHEAVEEEIKESLESVEEPPESKAQELSSHMLLYPRIRSPDLRMRVGFLGFGGLGKKIVRRLLADGYEVIIWNRTLSKVDEVVEFGARSKSTSEQVVDCCDVTFCCVSDTNAVKEVFYELNGALSGIRQGKSFVVLTTIEAQVSLDIEAAVKEKGGFYLEAPMFPAGGPIIDNALLTAVAGSQSCLRRCVPFFRSFVKDLFYVGDVPDGTKMVLVMKTLCGVQIAALAESMALAQRLNLPTDIYYQIIRQTQIASPFLVSKAEAMVQGGPWSEDDVFPLSHFSNDLSSALKLTDDLQTPVIATTKQVYVHSELRGYSDHDVSAVYLKYTESYEPF